MHPPENDKKKVYRFKACQSSLTIVVLTEIVESEMNKKAGKCIVKMRKLQLQNIVDGLEKTKDKLSVYCTTYFLPA